MNMGSITLMSIMQIKSSISNKNLSLCNIRPFHQRQEDLKSPSRCLVISHSDISYADKDSRSEILFVQLGDKWSLWKVKARRYYHLLLNLNVSQIHNIKESSPPVNGFQVG